MVTEVQHEPERQRYLMLRDGERIGLTDYRVRGDDILITHTEIEWNLRGNGLGGEMVRGVLDAIAADTDLRVVPMCPFVDDWIRLNPEYRHLTKRARHA